MSTNQAHLFSPIQLRSVTAGNRVWMSPMCQYCVTNEDGLPTTWHFTHYGSRAVGGIGVVIVEATAVEARGRITVNDLGLWEDGQVEAFVPITRFVAENGSVPAIQLAHAGRKARLPSQPIAPSPQAFTNLQQPAEMTEDDIAGVIKAFQQAAARALAAGFRAVEIHAAHGYLLHEFMSPLANQRTDQYGGSFENRTRLALEVVGAVRAVWPDDLPLFVRISATDWVEGGWDIEQSVRLARLLAQAGVDLIDTSSGGLSPDQKISLRPGYQVPFAERIRKDVGIATGTVGLITEAVHADNIVKRGQADVVLIGRQTLRDPYWPQRAATELGYEVAIPVQYRRAWLT